MRIWIELKRKQFDNVKPKMKQFNYVNTEMKWNNKLIKKFN